MKPRSKRFTPTRWTEYLVPAILLLLLLMLIATLALIVLTNMPIISNSG
jgi:ABC-type transport system involved in cytochrome bd biosynthesis fused ATPase/permease subunit